MNQTLNLREINQDDWKILLEWRNDVLTRQNFYSSQFVSESEHKNYIKDTILNINNDIYEELICGVGKFSVDDKDSKQARVYFAS